MKNTGFTGSSPTRDEVVNGGIAAVSNSHEEILPDKRGDLRRIIFVFIYLLSASAVIRLPYFFTSVIDWDESTFILMGQSILDGHLPYTELWDLKPPLVFLFHACAIALLGKSIVSVRIAGALCVAVTALFIYLTGKTLWNHHTGILGATLFIALSTLLPSGQATMSEHIATVPLVGALSLLITRRSTPRFLFLGGILMAIATLVRLNLAYVTIIVGFFAIVFTEPPRSIGKVLKRGLAYAAGCFLVIILTFLPYAVTGRQQLWWASIVLAPLSYSSSQLSLLGTLREQVKYLGGVLFDIRGTLFGLSMLVWLGGVAGCLTIAIRWRNTSRPKRLGSAMLIVFLCGTAISILKSGAVQWHYLIQLVPFMALTAAAFLNFCWSGHSRWLVSGVVLLAVLISMQSLAPEYKNLVSRILAGQVITHGDAYEIAAFLKQDDASGKPVYMMTDHIVYWLIDSKPLSKSTTHPSNITKEYLLNILVGPGASTETELTKILAKKPVFIVTKKNIWYLRNRPSARSLLEETLRTQYELVKEIQETQIYRRRQQPYVGNARG